MSQAIPHEVLIQGLQDGKIGWCEFVQCHREYKEDYLAWCRSHGVTPDDNNAEFWWDQTQLAAEESQIL